MSGAAGSAGETGDGLAAGGLAADFAGALTGWTVEPPEPGRGSGLAGRAAFGWGAAVVLAARGRWVWGALSAANGLTGGEDTRPGSLVGSGLDALGADCFALETAGASFLDGDFLTLIELVCRGR